MRLVFKVHGYIHSRSVDFMTLPATGSKVFMQKYGRASLPFRTEGYDERNMLPL